MSAGKVDYERFFRLQEGEKIVEAIKPLKILKWYFFLTGGLVIIIFGLIFGIGFVLPVVAYASIGAIGSALIALVSFLAIFGFLLIIPYAVAQLMYDKQYYWITNKRVIGKHGIIGYSVNSIPLERISDVIISRSFLERIFGFGSLHIQTLAGQVSYYGRFGAEGNFQAVSEPEELQRKIFELVKKKRKAEHITM